MKPTQATVDRTGLEDASFCVESDIPKIKVLHAMRVSK
jgi:hypothetical protein